MRVLVIANQKGGVGKTTLAGHLAVAASSSALSVACLDVDAQGSLSAWWNARTAEDVAFVQVNLGGLPTALRALEAQGIDLVVVDTPPAVSGLIREVVALADLVLIPTRPSPHDLRAVGQTVDVVDAAGKPMVFVVNGAAPRARITAAAAIELSQHGKVAPVTLFQRTDFAVSMIDGRTVMELDPVCRSACEIANLWKYVSAQLWRGTHLRNCLSAEVAA